MKPIVRNLFIDNELLYRRLNDGVGQIVVPKHCHKELYSKHMLHRQQLILQHVGHLQTYERNISGLISKVMS